MLTKRLKVVPKGKEVVKQCLQCAQGYICQVRKSYIKAKECLKEPDYCSAVQRLGDPSFLCILPLRTYSSCKHQLHMGSASLVVQYSQDWQHNIRRQFIQLLGLMVQCIKVTAKFLNMSTGIVNISIRNQMKTLIVIMLNERGIDACQYAWPMIRFFF